MTPETKLRVEVLSDGRIRLETTGPFEFEPRAAALVAAQILNAARDSHVQSGKPLPDFTRDPAVWVVLQTSALGLAPSQFPNHESLTVQFGETILALPIERPKLRLPGEGMVTLSASSERGH